MVGRIKVRGDLILAQSLETVFEKANGREVRKRTLYTSRHILILSYYSLACFAIY